jgi:hypothetical protein
VTQPQNASNGKLQGAEVGFTLFPQRLPGLLKGLGVQGSFTALDPSQNIPIATAPAMCGPEHQLLLRRVEIQLQRDRRL